MDLALNNLQRLICHKTKPNETNPVLKIWGGSNNPSLRLLLDAE